MTLVEQVQKVVEEQGEDFQRQPEFKDLETFYWEMVKKGLVRKNEYSLPQLDTVGKSLYRSPPPPPVRL